MDMLTSLSEEILYVPTVETRRKSARSLWRFAKWFGGVVIAVAMLLGIGAGIVAEVLQSRKEACHQRLKQLGAAMLAYHEEHAHFPAPSIDRADGTRLLSWRVALLPQLGHRSLYERFHLDEPWDSPHNRPLLAEMPSIYACPGGPGATAGRTGYQVVVGPKSDPTSINTAFIPSRGVDNREMTDGTSNTVLILETDTTVEWSKPDDLHWEPKRPLVPFASLHDTTDKQAQPTIPAEIPDAPLPRLASPHDGGAHVLFADGSVRFIKATIAHENWWSILTMNGGEVGGG